MGPNNLKVTFLPMGREECGNKGKNLDLNYTFASTPFGDILMASSSRGLCRLDFADSREEALVNLFNKFPLARFQEQTDSFQDMAMNYFSPCSGEINILPLHVRATEFQIKVWNALLEIPLGMTSSYGKVAESISSPKACRAVGSAAGSNPVALVIPCHRVITSTGDVGNYHWGPSRKKRLLEWESCLIGI